jgi:hypothetical protein
MKKGRRLVLIVLFTACQAVAQQHTNTVSASKVIAASASQTNASPAATSLTAPKPKFHWLGPPGPVQAQESPLMIERLDTRAWTTVVEERSSRSAFPDGHTHEAHLCLLWWGSEPRLQ